MSYHSAGTINGSTLEDITGIADMTVSWQNLNDFTIGDLSAIEPYLNELGLSQQECDPFILPPIHQDNPSLLHDATDQILPSSCFPYLGPQYSTFSIDMQPSPFPFTEQNQQTHDIVLEQPQQPQNQELLTKKPVSVLPSAGLSYRLEGNAQLQKPLQRSLEIPSTSVDGLGSGTNMGALVIAEQADGQSETGNQILVTVETDNTHVSEL